MRHPAHFIVTLAALSGCRASFPVVVDDHFDDGDPLTNKRGVGHGWYRSRSGEAKTVESDSVLRISSSDFGNVWLASKEADNFPFWNDTGATVTWHIKKTELQTPHLKNGTIVWYQLEVLSAKLKNSVNNVSGGKGAMDISIGFASADSDARCAVTFGNKNLDNSSDESIEKSEKAFPFSLPGYRAGMPLTVTARVSKAGWAVAFDRPATGTLSGNWSTDLGPQAVITDEFSNGAFVMMFWRTGTGGHKGPFPENAAEIDRVRVALGTGESRR